MVVKSEDNQSTGTLASTPSSEGTVERMESIDDLRIEKTNLRTELRATELQCEELRWLIAEIEAKIDLNEARDTGDRLRLSDRHAIR
jgi:hypothetical protein